MAASERNNLWRGRFLAIDLIDGWECCSRTTGGAVVAVVAVTRSGKIVLTEQFRPPLGARVIELPAGLAGDDPAHDGETLAQTAGRELQEETGYRAHHVRPLTSGPSSAGLSDEVVHFFAAEDLERDGPGGGVDGEQIDVHEIALDDLPRWLESRRSAGMQVDFKIYAGLYLIGPGGGTG